MGFQVTGLQEAIDAHREAARRARDLRPALEPTAAELRELVNASFGQQVSPAGDAWAPSKRGGSRASLAASVAIVAQPDGLSVEVRDPAASFFAFGSERQPGRNFLPFDRSGQPIMRGAARTWFLQMLERVRAYLSLEDRP